MNQKKLYWKGRFYKDQTKTDKTKSFGNGVNCKIYQEFVKTRA